MKVARMTNFSLWENFLLLVGRVLMGWIYVESGWRKLTGMDAFIASLVNRHVPYATVLGWIGASIEFFGGLALLLSAIGLYGLMAYSVAQRQREIGIKVALGAEPRRVMREVVRDQEPCGEDLGHAGRRDEILRLLLHRHRDHALEAELDPLRDHADRFRLLVGGVVVAPERLGCVLLAIGAELFPELRGTRDVGSVGHDQVDTLT